MAAIFAGWCWKLLIPCKSPAKICSGAVRATIHMAIENISRAASLNRSLKRCQAATAPTVSAVATTVPPTTAPPTTAEGEADRRAALDQINNEVILPAYAELEDAAFRLVDATTALCARPSGEAHTEARAVWEETWLAWLRTTAHSAQVERRPRE